MKITQEMERLKKRFSLLENQNVQFKNLLDSAIEVTKQSVPRAEIHKDETTFLNETIRLIEAEKAKLQYDLVDLKQYEREDITSNIKALEKENADMREVIKSLSKEFQNALKDIQQLKLEHSEFKFLLTQPESNANWLKTILQLDNSLLENANIPLMEQRYGLQQKIYKLEKKKTELLNVIDDISSPTNSKDLPAEKSVVVDTLYEHINDESKKEYEDLYIKVLDLEQERSTLLSQLQLVLESSRKEIAGEYVQLQKKIREIEIEKGGLKFKLKIIGPSKDTPETSEDVLNQVEDTIDKEKKSENEAVENILNAFTNSESQVNMYRGLGKGKSKGVTRKVSDTCIIA
ncbi:unnamed protein product [Diabrotica balteata]|uniref:Uncharacterized protein n=1 Tax=Diabrotica balteata TaxID=107213 RepID=A0A9N9XHY3_DIABA|nr:unnamed protein product [Diabrotica balteata]